MAAPMAVSTSPLHVGQAVGGRGGFNHRRFEGNAENGGGKVCMGNTAEHPGDDVLVLKGPGIFPHGPFIFRAFPDVAEGAGVHAGLHPGLQSFKEALIKSLSDFILEFLFNARNKSTRIASYLRRLMTKHWIKIHMKFDSAN
nr:hypothetical protein [uncultured Dialister sp.]